LLLAAFALLLPHGPGHAEARWPQSHGPNACGVADDQPAPAEFGLDKNVLWKTTVPSGHSSPCIWGERVFLTGYDKARKKAIVEGKLYLRTQSPFYAFGTK
jgi:outer membrane protein assembly factor BamB